MNAVKFYISLFFLAVFPYCKMVAQEQVQYILAGSLLHVAKGTTDENVLITITQDTISDIQIVSDVSGLKDYIDLSEYTVLPGLMDCHTHLTGNWYLDEEEFDEYRLYPASYGILGVLNAKKTLEAGFTTVRDVHSNFYGDMAIKDAIEKGWIEGPRMYVSGPGLSITGGHGAWGNWLAPHLSFKEPLISIADGEEEVRKEVRKHLQYQVDWIKVFATGGFYSYGTTPGAASYSIEELTVAVEEAAKQGRYVCAHAHGAEGIKNALKAGVKSIEHATYLDDTCIALFKEKNAYLVMDLKGGYYDLIEAKEHEADMRSRASAKKEYADMATRFKKAYDAGVKIAFGTDAGVYPHGHNAEQFGLMKNAGMVEIDIIRSATTVAAELLGVEDKLGSIEVGKLADIIAVKGDPLTQIDVLKKVVFVMKNGKVYYSNL